MTSATAIARYVVAFAIVIVLSGCHRSPDRNPVTAVDLVREFDRAERRPAAVFRVTDHRVGDLAQPSIVAPVPSRMTWSLPLPERGVFRASVALSDPPDGASPAAVRLRVGVSDHRIFEGLGAVTLEPGARRWVDLRADLSAYAGWKWSLFYRPHRQTWRLNLAADATGGEPAVVVWGSPSIVTDSGSAREYAIRRRSTF